MNLNSIINKIKKIFARKPGKAVSASASRQGKPAKDSVAADRSQANKAREVAKRARRAAAVTRRTGR